MSMPRLVWWRKGKEKKRRRENNVSGKGGYVRYVNNKRKHETTNLTSSTQYPSGSKQNARPFILPSSGRFYKCPKRFKW